MADSSYLRTKSISKRIGGVVVTVIHTGDATTTVTFQKGDAVIEVFSDTVAEIARAAREMLAILESES